MCPKKKMLDEEPTMAGKKMQDETPTMDESITYVLMIDLSEESTRRKANNDCNAYGWEKPRGNSNFHKSHAWAKSGNVPPYQKSVLLTVPRLTHDFDDDGFLAGNLHQKSKPVAQVISRYEQLYQKGYYTFHSWSRDQLYLKFLIVQMPKKYTEM